MCEAPAIFHFWDETAKRGDKFVTAIGSIRRGPDRRTRLRVCIDRSSGSHAFAGTRGSTNVAQCGKPTRLIDWRAAFMKQPRGIGANLSGIDSKGTPAMGCLLMEASP